MLKILLLLLLGTALCGASQFNDEKEQKHLRKIFYSSHKRAAVTDQQQDQCLKKGSFKIDDGPVLGGGIYEIMDSGAVEIDMKIKITSCESPSSPSGSAPTPAPGGAEATAAPGGAETTAAPGGAETTAAPGGAETTAAPGGAETTAAPGGAETTAAPASGSDVEQEGLELHNKFRKIHDSPDMTLNAEMSQSAADYAAKLANTNTFEHSDSSDGENLSYGCSSSAGQTAEEAVTNWYNEVCDPGYSFGSESMGGAGHFTQVVWKESTELGFGKADVDRDGMKCTYYVGRYRKAGNMGGEYSANVLKGSFDTSYCSTIKRHHLKSSLNLLHRKNKIVRH